MMDSPNPLVDIFNKSFTISDPAQVVTTLEEAEKLVTGLSKKDLGDTLEGMGISNVKGTAKELAERILREIGENLSSALRSGQISSMINKPAEPEKMAEGGIVPNDPTKHSEPGKKDKIDAKLEPGEAVGTRQDVAAMQSLLTTGGAKGMGIGGLAGAPAGGMPNIAKGPGGMGLAGSLGQPPIGMADGGIVGDSNAKTEIGMPAVYTSPQQMAAEVAIQRSQQTLAHAPSHPIATALQEVGSPTGQASAQTTAAFSTSVKETQLDAVQNQTGQSGVGPLAKPPEAGLLPGDIGAGNQPVTGSGPDDWSLPSSAVDKPTVPGSQGGQGIVDAPWALPAPKGGKRGRLAKAPSMDKFWGGLGTAAIDTMISKSGMPDAFQGIFAGTLKGALGLPGRGIGSGHGGGGGMGGMMSGLLGGSGGMGELLGGGGGGASGDNQAALLDAIKANTAALEALTEMLQTGSKDGKVGPQPDGSFIPSLGKGSAATVLAGAAGSGSAQGGGSSADMQKTITDTLLRAAMQAAMAAI